MNVASDQGQHRLPKYRNFCKLTTNNTNLTPLYFQMDLSNGSVQRHFWDFGKQCRPSSDAALLFANSVYLDQMSQNAESDQDHHYLLNVQEIL